MPALVLGGGGAFGIVQAAYIQAAYEMGFRPGLVVGTSVGALNGAWVALHPDEPEALLEIWQTLHRHRILRGNPLKVALRAARRRRGIFRNDLVSNLLRTHIRSSRFSETKLPLRVVATNLTRGCKHVFNNGLIAPAILASTAIPGFFDPIEIGGELFVDGGIAASVDLATAVEMGASEILAVELAPIATLAVPRTAVGVVRRSLDILNQSATAAMEEFARQLVPTSVLRPNLSRHSPWQIRCDKDEIELALAEARADLSRVLDSSGHVIPASGAIQPSTGPTFALAPHLAPQAGAPRLRPRTLPAS